MNRAKIKRKARDILRGNIWNFLKPSILFGLVFGAIMGIFGSSMADLDGETITISMIPSLLELLAMPISFGILAYQVKLVRKEDYDLNMIFSYYRKFWPIFCLNFFISLFIGLWSLLFIVPGIIAAYRYSMAMLIMIDGEEDPIECIKKSKQMMYGYKWDYFVFQLSFILWHLLGIITFGLAYIYVIPYISASSILYYDDLKKVNLVK